MRIYRAYKSSNGQKVYVGEFCSQAIDFVNINLPTLPEGEKYLLPELVIDRDVYLREIQGEEEKMEEARRVGDQETYFAWSFAVSALRETLAEIDAGTVNTDRAMEQ